MVIAAAASLSLGGPTSGQLCHSDGFCCSTSNGVNAGINAAWMSSPADNFRGRASDLCCGRNQFLGLTQFHLLSGGRDPSLFKVSVAADYSDSVPDSTNYTSYRGYHPLEEVKVSKVRDTQLTPAEIARTTVEANNSALLVFPGGVHAEPHNEISWAEFQYVVDDYGDIFFEVFDNNNILNDRGASNPVNALIGMDMPMYENKRVATEYDVFSVGSNDDIPFDDYYLAETDSEASDVAIDWGMPDNSSQIHPVYFAKCLTKAVDAEYDKKMDCPSNGVSIVGCLRPVFADDDTYLRRWPSRNEDSDGYLSEWKDGEILSFSSTSHESGNYSTLYKLDIMRIELFSVYGVQSKITLQNFQDAEPDMLAHSTSAIIEHFSEKGIECDVALKALCKRKGIQIEEAKLIGVDSLGMDVRILSGVEARTHRFPFKARATCEGAAERQIHQLLFPRSRRKKFRSKGDKYYRESKSF